MCKTLIKIPISVFDFPSCNPIMQDSIYFPFRSLITSYVKSFSALAEFMDKSMLHSISDCIWKWVGWSVLTIASPVSKKIDSRALPLELLVVSTSNDNND